MMAQKPVSLESRTELFDNEGKPTLGNKTSVILENHTVRKICGPWLELVDNKGGVLRGFSYKELDVDVSSSVRVYGTLVYMGIGATDLHVRVEDIQRYN